jgi:transcription initiation factor TFIIIB Brf1 subunit/transcription initiation factor TFIIB
MCNASLLVGKQPATVVATAIYFAQVDNNPSDAAAPDVGAICEAVGSVKVETLRKAIGVVLKSPPYLKRLAAIK